MAAPQEAEGRHRHQEVRAGRHLGRVVAHQAHVVVDMLQHVHHQHEVAVGRAAVAAIEHRLAVDRLVAVALVADIDAERGLRAAFGQEMTGEETRARPDIEQALRPEGADHAAERGCLGAVVPVPADVGAEDVLFLEIHQAFGAPSAPSS